MKVRREEVYAYYAFDGTRFDNPDRCEEYERQRLPQMMEFWNGRLKAITGKIKEYKKCVTSLEEEIVKSRRKVMSMVRQHRLTRNAHKCDEIGIEFGQLAGKLNSRWQIWERLKSARTERRKCLEQMGKLIRKKEQ